MTEANLVERVITHAKGIHCYDDQGRRYHAKLGDKVKISPGAAKRFARYCEAPGLAAAKAQVEEEETKAAAVVSAKKAAPLQPQVATAGAAKSAAPPPPLIKEGGGSSGS